jgi:predicted GIY-YIG superfamily endonuclease
MIWDNIINELELKLNLLNNSQPIERIDIKNIEFEEGIYVFYEHDKPLYVGRSNRIKARLMEHGRIGSKHFSASFAFILAKEYAIENSKDIKGKKREELEKDIENFNFSFQKERVSKMKIRAIEIKDAKLQAIFEIYAHIKLKTPYNTFENH